MSRSPMLLSPSIRAKSFTFGSPDYLAPVFMAVCQAGCGVRRRTPGLPCMRWAQTSTSAFVGRGDLDVVIGNWPEPPDRMHLFGIARDEIVCLVAADSPWATRGMTRQDYENASHVVPLPYSITQRGVIDGVLASERIERDERVVVQSFNIAPYLIAGTDLIFTTTRHFAAFYARLLPLAIVRPPIAFPPMRFYQLWHQRNHQSAAHKWLRNLLGDCGRQLAKS